MHSVLCMEGLIPLYIIYHNYDTLAVVNETFDISSPNRLYLALLSPFIYTYSYSGFKS